MNLISEAYFEKLKKSRSILLLIFFVLLAVCLGLYYFSFYSNSLYVSLFAGIASVILLALFFYGFIFEKSKLLKLYAGISSGIYQEDTYFFKKLDGLTEHDGVKLMRVICCFYEESEEFDRTLYFLSCLPYPELKDNQMITVKTYQNIILNIEIKD